jgi:tetratricopeptide (TPR) repeat protein
LANNEVIAEWLHDGSDACEAKDYVKALAAFERVLAWDPENPDALRGKADALCGDGKTATAISVYDRALRARPGDTKTLGAKGRALFVLGNFGGALKALEEALASDVESPALWDAKAAVLAKLARPDDAARCRKRSEELRLRERAERWVAEGDEFSRDGEHARAIGCYDEALAMAPDARAWERKGFALSALRNHKEALVCFDAALKLDPQRVEAWDGKGSALYALKDYPRALACFEEGLKLRSDDALLLDNKGVVLEAMGKAKEGKAARQKARELEQARRVRALLGEAKEHFAAGEYEEAVACCDDALEEAPRNTDALHLKGWALSAQHRFAGALQCYDEALKAEPGNVGVLNSKGEALFDLKRFDAALDAHQQALKIEPGNAQALLGKADAQFELGRYDEALASYTAAAKEGPDAPRARKALGQAKDRLEHLGRAPEAYAFKERLEELEKPKDVPAARPEKAAGPESPVPTKGETPRRPKAAPATRAARTKPSAPAEEDTAPPSEESDVAAATFHVVALLKQDASVPHIPDFALTPAQREEFARVYARLPPEAQKGVGTFPALLGLTRLVWSHETPAWRANFVQTILKNYPFLAGPTPAPAASAPRTLDEAVDRGYDGLAVLEQEINALARDAAKARQSGDAARAAQLEEEMSKKRDALERKLSMYSMISNSMHDSAMTSIRNIR